MQITIPPELEALIQKRIRSGAFSNVEEVLCHALKAQDFEEEWLVEHRTSIVAKIERAMEQVQTGRVYGAAEARRKLRVMRVEHLTKLS